MRRASAKLEPNRRGSKGNIQSDEPVLGHAQDEAASQASTRAHPEREEQERPAARAVLRTNAFHKALLKGHADT